MKQDGESHMKRHRYQNARNGYGGSSVFAQRGSALITGLVFLVVLTLLGLSASSGAIQRELIARNIRDENLALQAAEAALQAAENWIRLNPTFVASDVSTDGTCAASCEAGSASWWGTNGIVLGSGTNQTKSFPGVGTQPGYLIESMSLSPQQRTSLTFGASGRQPEYYRITARGTGLNVNTVRIVRSIYRRR